MPFKHTKRMLNVRMVYSWVSLPTASRWKCEEGIPAEQYAEPPLNITVSFCILVMGQNEGCLNKLQESALTLLADELQL